MKIKAQSFQNGAEMVVDKPVDIMFLNMIIYNILDKRNILWESFNKHPYILLPNFNDNNDEQFMQRFSDLVLPILTSSIISRFMQVMQNEICFIVLYIHYQINEQ